VLKVQNYSVEHIISKMYEIFFPLITTLNTTKAVCDTRCGRLCFSITAWAGAAAT